ncbi:MAG: metallophosphoesterase [Phascolarctobacterium sp.]|nr:metallophosphoesterase [Phascolarctobacterium sp.]
MKIGLVSDTHGNVQMMRKIVKEAPPVELWLHAGDHWQDANILAGLFGLRVVAVQGNTDPRSEDVKLDEFLEIEGFKVWLTHGHRYIEGDAKSSIGFWAKQLEQDICVYGHTHIPMNEYYGENLLVNPGSPSRPLGGSKPSYAVLTLTRGEKPRVEFYTLE